LDRSLCRLIQTANQLSHSSQCHGSLEDFLAHTLNEHNGDPKSVAAALGESSSSQKLPGLGVALAAEFLKNVGYDVCKPDRHINRALGSFGLVHFTKWPDCSGTSPPNAKPQELRRVMQVMEDWARQLRTRVAFLDNAVWFLCAKSRLYLNNHELAVLAGYH
jgi:hypothetical protein